MNKTDAVLVLQKYVDTKRRIFAETNISILIPLAIQASTPAKARSIAKAISTVMYMTLSAIITFFVSFSALTSLLIRLRIPISLFFAGHHYRLNNQEDAQHGRNGNTCPPGLIQTCRCNYVLNSTQRQYSEQCSDDIADSSC